MLACQGGNVSPVTRICALIAVLPLLPAAGPLPRPQRPVAKVVSSAWGEEAARDKAGEAADVIRIASIKPGMAVADIGTGGGYYVMRVAPVVGPQGRVFAQDLVYEALDHANSLRMRQPRSMAMALSRGSGLVATGSVTFSSSGRSLMESL